MNINNWTSKKKVWAIILGLLAIAGLVLTIFLVQKVQEIRSRAEKATILSLSPTNQNVNPGEDAKLDVTINPGINQVNFVRFTIKFDPAKFDPSLTVFNIDDDSPLKALNDTAFTSYTNDGEVTFTLSVGKDATKVVRETTKLGQLLVPVRDDAGGGESQIIFNEEKTQVRSVGGGDPFTQNVLSSTVPATVTIGAPVCRPNVGTCSWDETPGASFYHVIIKDEKGAIIKNEDVESQPTKIEFDSIPGKTYTCEVTPRSFCGKEGPSGNGTSTCPLPSVTPTPTPTPSPSPRPTPTLTPAPTKAPSPTPTPTEKSTPTPTPTPTKVVTSTPTPTIAQGGGITTTPVPTLPPTGNPFVMGGILGGVLFILGGLALLLL